MRRRTVLSLEQALSMPYATLRFVQLGWRVIRIEATGGPGGRPGDPNRYVGKMVVDEDRHSYFIGQNVGKEAIALNLKEPEGREILQRLIRELDVDVFCCNTIPGRYESLGIDYETLSAVKPDLIWAGISAMGPDYPNTPGYDPAIQAVAAYMEVTGPADGPPTLAGVPIIDLKAGDEVYANVMLALAEMAEAGPGEKKGKRIDVSMLQAAASWQLTTLPLLDFDCDADEVGRAGNEHRKFVPCNAYPTSDGYIYVAIGNDIQWQRLTDIPTFASIANQTRQSNAGRIAERAAIHADIAAITARHTRAALAADFAAAKIPNAPINTVRQMRDEEAIRPKLTRTSTPDGHEVRLPPLTVDLDGAATDYDFPHKFGEDTDRVLREAGVDEDDLARLRDAGVIG